MELTEDRIMVTPLTGEEKTTEAGIIIPAPSQDKDKIPCEWGRVDMVGKGRFENGKFIKMRCSRGDRVLYNRGKAYPMIDRQGKPCLILREIDVWAFDKKR